ncbi:MAG: hypothetical protein JSV90_06785 [Methanobacteriota archaeon]|nr:MAG: hypothetical protein JSV90_06785 [Euryarchaeota archaeon]
MAKKRKKDKKRKEEEYEFKPPEFDEEEFLRRELRDTKTVLMTVGYAALFGIVAAVLSNLSSKLIGISFLLVFVGLYSLRYFYQFMKVKTEEFQKKNWAGNVAWFFLTFLAVWVLTFNYPFSDHANPEVEDVVVWVTDLDTGSVTAFEYYYNGTIGAYRWSPDDAKIAAAGANLTVNITARVSDNGALSSVEISVGRTEGAYETMEEERVSRYGYELTEEDLEGIEGELMFFIHAEDRKGNEITFMPVVGLPIT